MAETLRMPLIRTPGEKSIWQLNDAGEDGQLVRGIDSVDIETGIGLA